jgi:hypothetical protein
MRAIMSRLRRLENATAPVERERVDIPAILRSLGYDEAMTFSAKSLAGCHKVADRITALCSANRRVRGATSAGVQRWPTRAGIVSDNTS